MSEEIVSPTENQLPCEMWHVKKKKTLKKVTVVISKSMSLKCGNLHPVPRGRE